MAGIMKNFFIVIYLRYHINIEFRTKICQSEFEGTHCIYSTTDSEEKNLRKKIVGFVTKFEPCFGRTFIPGWDEPRIKTTFNITIRYQNTPGLKILTNTAIKQTIMVSISF